MTISNAIAATVSDLADRVMGLKQTEKRKLIAVAGPPAAGKSTLAAALTVELQRRGAAAILMPMDGFHLDNLLLESRGILAKKGAPETFDFAGFYTALQRVRSGDTVILPVFDRNLDIAIAGAQVVPPETKIVIVEGNYLCFDEPPWRDLVQFWAFSIYLDVPLSELKRRNIQRWRDHGLDQAAAKARALSNDIPNAQRVVAARCPVDLVIKP